MLTGLLCADSPTAFLVTTFSQSSASTAFETSRDQTGWIWIIIAPGVLLILIIIGIILQTVSDVIHVQKIFKSCFISLIG